ncbi:MAG TPA: imelysin family protein [Cellvibrionaceae bacterium]
MSRVALTLFLPLFSLSLLTACDKTTPPAKSALPPLATVQAELINPWHQSFVSSSTQLKARVERFCQNPANPGEYQEARTAWLASMLAWQQVNLIKFGPISEDNQGWKIQFWPDNHNLVEKKVKALLDENEHITEEVLGGASVVAQGLSAVEFLLYDPQYTDSAALGGKPCDLLRLATTRVEGVAKGLLSAWQQGSLGAWQPAALTVGSEAEKTALLDLAKSLVTSLEIVKKDKLEGPIGSLTNPEAKPFHSESWRSTSGKAALLAQLKGANALFEQGLAPLLKSPEQQALKRTVQENLSTIIKDLEANPAELVALANTEAGRTLIVNCAQLLGKVNGLLKREIPQSLGLQLGFNGNDGD